MASCWDCCRRACMCFLSEDEQKTIIVDNEIKKILKKQKKKDRQEIKILLLGTGESGKTTFVRQMRIIHGRGFSEEDRLGFSKCIFQNIFTAIKAMTAAMSTLRIPYSNPENEIYATWLQDFNTAQITQLERRYVDAIRRLWADSGIRVCYSRRCEYQLLDSTEYYMNNLERIAAPDYIPTEQDVLRVRFPTTGINDYSFTIEKITLRIVDVGGQKSERRKWIHCFENVTSLIFLASLSEYDQVLDRRSLSRYSDKLTDLLGTQTGEGDTNSTIFPNRSLLEDYAHFSLDGQLFFWFSWLGTIPHSPGFRLLQSLILPLCSQQCVFSIG